MCDSRTNLNYNQMKVNYFLEDYLVAVCKTPNRKTLKYGQYIHDMLQQMLQMSYILEKKFQCWGKKHITLVCLCVMFMCML